MIFEIKNFLSKKNIDFIENKILFSQHFPFYLKYQTISTDKVKNFQHVVLAREEMREENYIFNHPYAENFVSILKDFSNSSNITINKILRIAINITYNCGIEKSGPHKDHEFEHKQLIIYLNDCLDKNANTVIVRKNNSLLKIKPEKYKGLYFDENLDHYIEIPKVGERIIMVFTFL